MSTEIPSLAYPGELLSPLYRSVDSKNKNAVHRFEAGNGAIEQQIEINNIKQTVISATLLGKVVVEEILENVDVKNDDDKDNQPKGQNNELQVQKFRISVIPTAKGKLESRTSNGETNTNFANSLPKEGDIVLTKVTKLNLRQAFVEILAVEGAGNVLTDSGIGSNGNGVIAPGGGSGASTFSIHLGSSDLGENFKGVIRSQDIRSTERDKVKVIDSFKPGDIVRAQILSLGDGTNYYLTTARNDLGVVFAKSHNGAGGLMYAIDWQTMVCAKTGEIEHRKCAKPF